MAGWSRVNLSRFSKAAALFVPASAWDGRDHLQTTVYVYDLDVSKTQYSLPSAPGCPIPNSIRAGSGSAPAGLSAVGEPFPPHRSRLGLKLDTTGRAAKLRRFLRSTCRSCGRRQFPCAAWEREVLNCISPWDTVSSSLLPQCLSQLGFMRLICTALPDQPDLEQTVA